MLRWLIGMKFRCIVQESTNCGNQAGSSHCLCLNREFYWTSILPVHLLSVCGCFLAAVMEWRGCHRDWLADNTENVYSLALFTEVFWPLAHTVPYLKDSIKNLALILRAEEAYEDFPFRRIALAAQWWKTHRLHRSVHSQPEFGWPFTVSTLLSWASILKESPCRKPLWLLPEDDLLGPSQPLGVPSKDEAPGTGLILNWTIGVSWISSDSSSPGSSFIWWCRWRACTTYSRRSSRVSRNITSRQKASCGQWRPGADL